MAKTIGTLAYAIVADTRQFAEGMTLTRNEAKLTASVMEATEGPVKRFAAELDGLNAVRAKGAISNMQYVSSVNKLIAEKTAGIPVIGRFTSVLSLGNPVMIAGATATAGLAAGFAAVAAAAAYSAMKIKDQIGKIDELITEASTLGIATNVFQEMSVAAKFASIETGELTGGIRSMMGTISKAVAGGETSKFSKLFAELHLDAKELKAMSPERQLLEITRALDGMASQSDRVRIAAAIFGDADFLRLDVEHLELARNLIKDIGGEIDGVKADQFNELDTALKKLKVSMDLSWKKLAMAFVPAMENASEAMFDFVRESNKSSGTVSDMESLANAANGAVEVFKALARETRNWLEYLNEQLTGPLPEMLREMWLGLQIAGSINRMPAGIDVTGQSNDTPTGPAEDAAAMVDDYTDAMERAADAAQHMHAAGSDLVANLQEQIATFGMSAEQAAIFKAAQQGASIAALVTATALADQLEQLKAKKKADDDAAAEIKRRMDAEKREADRYKADLERDAEAAKKSLLSPLELAEIEIKRYKEMLEAGLLTEEQFDKLRDKTLEKAQPKEERREPIDFRNPAMMRGSQEAFALLINSRLNGPQKVEERMLSVLEDIRDGVIAPPLMMPVITSFGSGGI